MSKKFDLKTISSGKTALEIKNKILNTIPVNKKEPILNTQKEPKVETLREPLLVDSLDQNKPTERVLEARPTANIQSGVIAELERSQSGVINLAQSGVIAELERSLSGVINLAQSGVSSGSRAESKSQNGVSSGALSGSRAESVLNSGSGYISGINLTGLKQIKLLALFADSCLKNQSLESDFLQTTYLYAALENDKEALRKMFKVLMAKGVISDFTRLRGGREGLNKVCLTPNTYTACLKNETLIRQALSGVTSGVTSGVLHSSSIVLDKEKNTTTTEKLGNQNHWVDSFSLGKFSHRLLNDFRFELDESIKKGIKNSGASELNTLTKVLAFRYDQTKSSRFNLGLDFLAMRLKKNQPYNSIHTIEAEKEAKKLLGISIESEPLKNEIQAVEETSKIDSEVLNFIRNNPNDYLKIIGAIKEENPKIMDSEAQELAIEEVMKQIITLKA